MLVREGCCLNPEPLPIASHRKSNDALIESCWQDGYRCILETTSEVAAIVTRIFRVDIAFLDIRASSSLSAGLDKTCQYGMPFFFAGVGAALGGPCLSALLVAQMILTEASLSVTLKNTFPAPSPRVDHTQIHRESKQKPHISYSLMRPARFFPRRRGFRLML